MWTCSRQIRLLEPSDYSTSVDPWQFVTTFQSHWHVLVLPITYLLLTYGKHGHLRPQVVLFVTRSCSESVAIGRQGCTSSLLNVLYFLGLRIQKNHALRIILRPVKLRLCTTNAWTMCNRCSTRILQVVPRMNRPNIDVMSFCPLWAAVCSYIHRNCPRAATCIFTNYDPTITAIYDPSSPTSYINFLSCTSCDVVGKCVSCASKS